MHSFSWQQLSAQMLLHHKAVLKLALPLSRNTYTDVAVTVDVGLTFMYEQICGPST